MTTTEFATETIHCLIINLLTVYQNYLLPIYQYINYL